VSAPTQSQAEQQPKLPIKRRIPADERKQNTCDCRRSKHAKYDAGHSESDSAAPNSTERVQVEMEGRFEKKARQEERE